MSEASNSPSGGRSPILADLQRELAGLRAERQEARAREAAIAEILQTINDSPGDLAPVFDAILGKAHKLCGITFGSLQLYENGKFRAVAVRGMADSLAALLREPVEPVPGTPVWRLAGGERFVQIDDVGEEAKNHPEHRRANASAAHGLHTVLSVPLRQGANLLGYITGYREEVRPFSEEEIVLLENFAAQAVIAMENARLLTETREALEQQTATADVLGVINASLGDLTPVFDAMLEKATRLCEAPRGQLATFDGEFFRFVAVHGEPGFAPGQFELGPIRPEIGVTWPSIAAGVPVVHIADVKEGELYRKGHEGARRFVDVGGGRTLLSVALSKEGRLLGVLTIYRQEVRPFSDKQIALLQNFAAQAVIAMENARLLTETREALEQQTAAAEVLGVINASLGDLSPVFDAMLEKATRLCEAPRGQLATYDGKLFRFVAAHGDETYVAELLSRGAMPPEAGASWPLIARGERVVHMPDVMESELYRSGHANTHRFVHVGGGRSLLTVALHKDESLLGALTIYRYEVKPFTDRQIALLQNFAAQAVIAMENARLLTETREALEQQTATAEVLQVINSSPGDLRPVFEAMLGKAMHLCEANFGFLSTYDGERFDAIALHGLPQTYVREYLTGPYLPGPGTTHDRLVRGELVVHVPNLAIDQADSLRRRAVVDVLGVRSILAVPLRKDGMLVGAIHVFRQEVRPFTDKQIALLQNFAAQAVVAMDNARLLTETREALEQQTATAEVLGVINASPGDLAPVFDAILEKAHTLCGADHGSLTLAEGESFRAVAMRGMREEFAEELRRPFHPGWLVERLSSGEQFVQVADLAATTASPDNPVHRAAVEAGGVRTLLAVPLRKEQKLLGYITANRREVRSFTDKQIALLQNFAAQAVIAMENARLLTETREALEQQTATAEVLGVINASPGDLAPVFDAILEKAHTLCEADYGALLTYDGERFRPVAGSGASARFSELMHDGIRPSSRNSFGQLMRGERFVHIRDMVEIAQELDDPVPRSLAETGEIRTQLMVPLRKDGTVLGVITANRRVVRPFTDRQIALLENFAAQAVIAMENARLLGELRERNDEIAGWNKELEDRVAAQLGELERVGKLKRFLAPQLAELIVARGDEAVLETHRRDIVVVFCDLRDFTAFAETAEPEEVLDLLREYHGSLGPIVSASEGTLDHFSGDGIMVFFNDPVPVADASERAVKMAIEMREAMAGLQAQWRRQGRRIGFGAGIARGYATLGQIGFADRVDYTAIGTVCNLAARLCAEAKDGQILVSQRVAAAVEDAMALEEIGELSLKGLREPGAVYNVPLAGGQAALRVIEGGAPTL